MKRKTILLTLTLCILSNILHAQEQPDYRSFWEYGNGISMNLSQYNQQPDNGRAFLSKGKPQLDFMLRYQRFFDKHWGAFLSLSLDVGSNRQTEEILKGITPQHGMSYLLPTEEKVQSNSRFNYSIGITYRHTSQRWSFRPRLGFGITGYLIESDEFTYYSKAQGSNRMLKTTLKQGSDKVADVFTGFTVTPGISVAYTLTGALYLFGDCSYEFHPCKNKVTWLTTDVIEQTPVEQGSANVRAGNHLVLRMGLGLQFGKKKKKEKKNEE